ncbi:AT-rich interactive domain-containing protein 3 [Orobanche hederae]
MEDNNKGVQDALGGSCGTAADEQQSQHVENTEIHEIKNMEVEKEIEHKDGKNSFESAPMEDLSQVQKNPSELTNTIPDVQAEDEKGQRELNGVEVPEVLFNGFREEELENDSTTTAKVVPNSGNEVEELKTEPDIKPPSKSFLLDANDVTGDESGTEEEQAAFMKELDTFHRERCLDFKPPKFYQEPLNCLKLWRAVIRLRGYEQVTSLKLWRQVGESFRPPKTCTTVSWTFRGFYEKVLCLFALSNMPLATALSKFIKKSFQDHAFCSYSDLFEEITSRKKALLEYEKYKMRSGELPFTDASLSDPTSGNQVDLIHPSGSGRARRDAAARAMQGWHSQRLLGNGEVGDPIIKEKSPITTPKREKQLRNIGFLKRKGSSPVEHAVKVARMASKSQSEIVVVDVGVPADWVKVNVQRMKDCYEVYALVPGLLREEVRVQSDPAGRLVISGQPEQQDNPWGVAPFKKVVSLPTRIDPHHTSAVVTLHGQLFVRVPFEPVDM